MAELDITNRADVVPHVASFVSAWTSTVATYDPSTHTLTLPGVDQVEAENALAAFVPPGPDEILQRAKDEYCGLVDVDAEAVRQRHITAGAGQALTYQEKSAQAVAVLALGEAAANALSETERIAQYPTLAASVGTEADTLYACAELVQAKYEAFADLSYIIERTRLQGKATINAAVDVSGVESAYASITWE